MIEVWESLATASHHHEKQINPVSCRQPSQRREFSTEARNCSSPHEESQDSLLLQDVLEEYIWNSRFPAESCQFIDKIDFG